MRKFLFIVPPLLLPFLLYWVYLTLARRKADVARAAGGGRRRRGFGSSAPGWR